MKQSSVEVYWEGEYLGSVLNPKGDNFDFYGEWNPITTQVYAKFLEALEQDGEVWVAFGADKSKPIGTVEFCPDDEIEIKLRPIP